MSIVQYLRDTQAELRHVAWPTRTQTIVYTALVAALSIFVALYLGFFDLVFTRGLGAVIDSLPTTSASQNESIQLSGENTEALDITINPTPETMPQ